MLVDSFHRQFSYLRLSITEACNFRCQYCLPNGYQKTNSMFLSVDEIERVAIAFAGLGVTKIRLTGGEPTVRQDLEMIANRIRKIPTIRKLAMTTNGYLLKKKAAQFYEAGINALNISIDSLNQKKFYQITGHDKLSEILLGIEQARHAGFNALKINTVLLKDVNDSDDDFREFFAWIKSEALSVRFIELMQTGNNKTYFDQYHVSGDKVKSYLIKNGFTPIPKNDDDGPAVEFSHPDYAGKMGIIAPYSKDFCKTCNRLRVTAKGDLKLCLFGELGYSLRPWLDHDDKMKSLQDKIAETVFLKKSTHYLAQGKTGITPHLASVGG